MIESMSVERRRVAVGALLLVVAAVLVVRQLGGGDGEPRAAPARVQDDGLRAEAAPKLVVHVVGAVRRPGLYKLAERSRVADAVARAGGAKASADLSAVNLAAPVADGLQIVVPARAPPSGGGSGSSDTAGSAGGPVHLNTASVEELDALPGVGPVTAQKIFEYRQQHGAFTSVDDLDAIPGIGPARLEQLREVAAP